MPTSLPNSVICILADDAEIYNQNINSINTNSLDAENLQVKAITYVGKIIDAGLAYIQKPSIESGVFPSKMKLEKVNILHKGSDVKNMNCRRILVLPIFSSPCKTKYTVEEHGIWLSILSVLFQ